MDPGERLLFRQQGIHDVYWTSLFTPSLSFVLFYLYFYSWADDRLVGPTMHLVLDDLQGGLACAYRKWRF